MRMLLALTWVAACGNSAATSGTYAAKCQLACAPPSGPCQSQDPTSCQQACVTTTEGLSATCAECIAEHTGWTGYHCVSNCKTAFGPGGRNSICSGGSTCSASDESCTGFVTGKVTDTDCTTACAAQP